MKFHLIMAALAALAIALCSWAMFENQIAVSLPQLLSRLGFIVSLWLGFAYAWWRKAPRFANCFAMAFWSVAFSNILLIPQYLIVRQHAELDDAFLARLDAALGIEVPRVLSLVGNFPSISCFLARCYNSLIILMTLAIVIPPLCAKVRQAKEYLIACIVSVALGMPMFAALQAVGPWYYHGYPPSLDQAQAMKVFFELKGDNWFVLDFSDINGLVSFPSYHTILAILASATLWSIPYLRWPCAALALLTILSTVTTGWHYVADVLGGAFIAILSLSAARLITRLTERQRINRDDESADMAVFFPSGLPTSCDN